MGVKKGFQIRWPDVELSTYESVHYESFDCIQKESLNFKDCYSQKYQIGYFMVQMLML